jgi:DNA-binding transcriptional regulator YdaS (Cro superfamily)
MKLLPYLKTLSPDRRRIFAARCDTSLGHMTNVAYGYKPCAESLAIAIERESAGAVTVEELRPDVDWAVIRGKPAGMAAA